MGIKVEEIKIEPNISEKLQILFVGRIARVRRIELLLQAASQLTIPFHLTIVGGEEKTSSITRGGYLDELQLLTKQLNLNNKVTFTGKKAPSELKPFYKLANIFVYPSLYENFGQPLIEAAAHGLPLISTMGFGRSSVNGRRRSPLPPAILRAKNRSLIGCPQLKLLSVLSRLPAVTISSRYA